MKPFLAVALLSTSLLMAQAPSKETKPAPGKAAAAKTAPPTVGKKADSGTTPETGLLGNKDSKTFHRADCKTAQKMKAENKIVLSSKSEAEKQGYKACKICKP